MIKNITLLNLNTECDDYDTSLNPRIHQKVNIDESKAILLGHIVDDWDAKKEIFIPARLGEKDADNQ